MPLFKFTSDQTVKRLRWVMIGAILFCMVNTLAGQPESFWHYPETAIRADGLSIYNQTNRTFDFFLGRGWMPYLLACLIYLSASFSFVSLLPRKTALTAIFSFLFGHFFEANNWVVVRWHLGLNATTMYGFVLATIIVFAVFPTMSSTSGQIVKRLRWMMLVPMCLDMINTLVGQPSSYWLHTETAHEANEVSRFFLIHGWYAYVFWDIFYFSGGFLLVSILPRRLGLICIFIFTLTHFVGASNWFFYEWRMGMETPVIFGIILSVMIVMLAFPTPDITTPQDLLSNEAAA
jgi:hypothetical protein